MTLLAWLESTGISVWIREDPSLFAFPGILTMHTVGMALIVGFGVALDLRVLGVAPGVPLDEMRRFFPPMWLGLGLNVVSGLLLLVAYPTKALTNPVFYLKLGSIGIALYLLRVIRRRLSSGGRLRLLAAGSIFFWALAIASGRLLAYTYTRLWATGPL